MASRKNILIVTPWSYNDALIQAYTLPYVRIIRKNIDTNNKVLLVTFDQPAYKMDNGELSKIKTSLKEEGIELVTFSYTKFDIKLFIKAFSYIIQLYKIIKKNKIDVIHSWCTPAGSLGYLLSKLTKTPLVIDSYEPHAEAMVENGTWKKGGVKFKILNFFERKLTHSAKVIISATRGMREYAASRYGCNIRNFLVKPACVDLNIFNLSAIKNDQLLNELGLNNKIVCVYAGKFGGIYLTQEVFDFLKVAEDKWGDKFRALFLTNHNKDELIVWSRHSGFDEQKMICKFVSHSEVIHYLALGSFAITPVKPIPTKKFCSPIKDGEYWGLGLPVVITKDISDDSELIEKYNAGSVLNMLNKAEYKKAIDKIETLISSEGTRERINQIAHDYRSFEIAELVYKRVYGNDEFNLNPLL